MEYMNQLMPFFNSYYDTAHIAMTKGLRTEQEYDEMIYILNAHLEEARRLIQTIPNEADDCFREDTNKFLQIICKRLANIIERQEHLKGKSFHFEKYSFFDDRKYIKADMEYEKQLTKLGEAMNYHKQHIITEVGM